MARYIDQFDSITIEPSVNGFGGAFVAYGHGEYPENSVLAGQSRRSFLMDGELLELRTVFPQAEVLDYSTREYRDPNASLAELSGLPRTPPSDFSELDAGERWNPDE